MAFMQFTGSLHPPGKQRKDLLMFFSWHKDQVLLICASRLSVVGCDSLTKRSCHGGFRGLYAVTGCICPLGKQGIFVHRVLSVRDFLSFLHMGGDKRPLHVLMASKLVVGSAKHYFRVRE